MKRKRRQADWMADAMPGDVLISPSGTFRIIRSLGRFPDGDLRSATFVIKRCSWTKRGYTIYYFTDLLQWSFATHRELPRTKIDLQIAQDMRRSSWCGWRGRKQKLGCCDVVGVP